MGMEMIVLPKKSRKDKRLLGNNDEGLDKKRNEAERLLYKERNGREEIVWAMEEVAPVCSPVLTN